MKMMPKLRKHNYLTRIGIFLIAMALIVGLVSCEGGCDGDGDGVGVRYTLTMAANPLAGGTATDLTGGSPYLANTSVNIQAVANPGYQFSNWSAPAGTFGNAALATTTFTMPAQNVTVTANFALTPAGKLDHFTWYEVDSEWLIMQDVILEDQFGTFNATVWDADYFCNPAGKSHEGNVYQIKDSNHHFTSYSIFIPGDYVLRQVEVDNQFGVQNLTVEGPYGLLVPTQKEGHAAPVGLDHYLVYMALGSPVAVNVSLNDQWGNQTDVHVYEPKYFATPVKKTHDGNVTDIVDPDVHLVIYDMYGWWFDEPVQVANQFGNQTLNVSGPYYLAVPSEKIVPPTLPLDHFKCYNVMNATPVWNWVNLVVDQFGDYSFVQVMEADWFCNPVQKNTEPVVNPDNHLTVYNITWLVPDQNWWYVEVDNQFGFQNLTVYGPVALAAPTWKLLPGNHTPPKYLDHYLLYEVWSGWPVNVTVNLDDQFPEMAIAVNVTYPRYFANPVIYKEHGVNFTGVWDPETHLVFYDISDNPEFYSSPVWVSNQFEERSLNLTPKGQLLAVPSEKWYYEQI
jgi:hypothetical protein